VVEVGEAEVDEHQRRRSGRSHYRPIANFAALVAVARARTTAIAIAPPVPRRRAVDQRVPRLDVPVHYAGGVQRVQRYQEVAEVVLHLALGEVVIVLLLATIVVVVVVFSSVVDAIVVIPAVECASRCRRRVVLRASLLMMPMPTSAVAEPLGFGTGVLQHQRGQLPRLPSLLQEPFPRPAQSIVLAPVESVVPVVPMCRSPSDRRGPRRRRRRRMCVGSSYSSFPSIERGPGSRLLAR
jgi:hypothetical protein